MDALAADERKRVEWVGVPEENLEVSTGPGRMRAGLGPNFFNQADPARFGPGRTIS